MNQNKTTKFFDGAKVSRARQMSDKEDRQLVETLVILGFSVAFLIMASVASTYGHITLMWVFISLASVLIFLWASIHVVPGFWKWFLGLVAMLLVMVGCQHELKGQLYTTWDKPLYPL